MKNANITLYCHRKWNLKFYEEKIVDSGFLKTCDELVISLMDSRGSTLF